MWMGTPPCAEPVNAAAPRLGLWSQDQVAVPSPVVGDRLAALPGWPPVSPGVTLPLVEPARGFFVRGLRTGLGQARDVTGEVDLRDALVRLMLQLPVRFLRCGAR
jgi:hypothetical protein